MRPQLFAVRRLISFLTICASSFAALQLSAHAQTGPEVQDVRPYAPLTGTSIESISLMNGSLNVNIPLWSFAQRGKLKLDFRLGYDTTTYVETKQCVFGGVGGGFPGGDVLRPFNKRAHISKETENYVLQTNASVFAETISPNAQAPGTSCSNPIECLGGDICILNWVPGGYDQNYTLYKPEDHEGIRVYASTDIAVFPEIGVGHETDWNKTEYFTGIYWKVRTPDGGSHNLAQTTSGDFRAADGTGWEYQPDSCTLRDNEGTVYSFFCTPPSHPGGFTDWGLEAEYVPGVLNYEEDTNGNRITVNYAPGGNIVSWSDSMGRTIPAPPLLPTSFFGPPTGTTLPPPAAGCPAGSTTSYSWQIPGVSTPMIFCETYTSVHTHLFPAEYYITQPPYATYMDFIGTIPMIAGLIQPSGDTWKFQYTPIQGDMLYGTPYNNGDLSQITLPTGGTIQYTWDTPNNFCEVKPQGATAHGKVTTRTLSAGNGTTPSTWRYGGNFPTDSGLVVTVAETDPVGNVTNHTITPVGGCSYYEGSTTYYDNQQNLLKTETTAYQGIPAPEVLNEILYASGALPIAKSTTWPDGTNTTTTFAYDSGFTSTQNLDSTPYSVTYGNQILKNEYGFSSGAGTLGTLLRSTATTYMAFGSYAESAAAFQQNMISLPSTVVETDVLNNTQHDTAYGYDELSPVSGNASPNCGTGSTVICWDQELSNGPVRGNQTTVARSLNTTGGVLTTQVGYTDTGLIASITLPSNTPNPDTTMTYGYSGAYQGTLLTSVSNSLGQTKSYSYDPVTTLLQTAQDENSNVTHYYYFPDTRLKSIVYPSDPSGNQPETGYWYPNPNQVDKNQKQGGSTWIHQQSLYDGLGRTIATKLLGGCPGGDFITTNTSYDLLGRVDSVTNPQCGSSSSSTDGVTVHQYDALSRPTALIEPDGNAQHWSYFDDTTTFTDENQSAWARTTDALGRLAKVIEPTGLETDYTYDGFDNLTYVNQIGLPGTTPAGFVTAETSKTRSFTYDTLNRLITSTNPESGEICYGTWTAGTGPHPLWLPPPPPGGGGGVPPGGNPPATGCVGGYDAHGNLLAKTDNNLVTMSYTYDALNRLTSKTSSDTSVADSYVYDQTGTGSNEMGRLSSSHSAYAGNTFSYDSMGRVVSGSYYTPATSGPQSGMAMAYDLTGNPTLITYPDGTQVSQSFDAANRLTSVSSGSTNYISGISYTPASGDSASTFGNGVTQLHFYNNRLQPCRTTVLTLALAGTSIGSPGGPISGPISGTGGTVLDRESFYNPSVATNCGYEANNNGNIYAIVDNQNVGWTQSFTYDPLNRLTSAFRSDGGYNHTYNYDSFGNLAVQDNLHMNPSWGVEGATNQLMRDPGVHTPGSHTPNDFQYDNAGNMTSSGIYPIGHTYLYNALSQLMSVDLGTTASYNYDGNDDRVYKMTGTDWTQYVYANGQAMAELNSAGTWTDYIYANGQKIAKVDSQKPVLQLTGYRDGSDTSCGVESPMSGASPGIVGLTIAAGDQLVFDMYQSLPSYGGLGFIFTDGNGTGLVTDTNGTGEPLYFNGEADAQWHHMAGDLSSLAGEVVDHVEIGLHDWMPFGNFVMDFANAGVLHADGSFTAIYTGQPGATVGAFIGTNCGGQNMTAGTVQTPITNPSFNTDYFADDHLGTAQMEFNGAGWPVWQGQFTPFGKELPDGHTDMAFKFTGKERDKETDLDNFGARYYASHMGRWMSPDWADKPEAVPYSSLDNPQTLNLYGYVKNNPLSQADPDGHDADDDGPQQATAPAPPTPTATTSLMDKIEAKLAAAAEEGLVGGAGISGSAVVTGIAIVAIPAMLVPDTVSAGDLSVDANGKPIIPASSPAQPSTPAPAVPTTTMEEHTKNARPSTKDDHERRRPGTSPPPNYKPNRKYKQPKDDKKKDKAKQPYVKKDRDTKKYKNDQ